MILNNITEQWLLAYVNRPRAALIIESKRDNNTAIEVTKNIYKSISTDASSPIQIHDFSENTSIGIDDTRDIQRSLQLRANSDNNISRMVVICRAHLLTNEAQNSILKLIEELPSSTIIVLIAEDKKYLLPTINSRCFSIPILPITEEQSIVMGKSFGASESEIKKAYLLSDGNYSDLHAIFNGDSQLTESINRAKEFLKDSVYNRQKFISSMKDKYEIEKLINALLLTSKSGMRLAKTLEAKKRWSSVLKSVLDTEEQISSNVNTKLALLNLSVALP